MVNITSYPLITAENFSNGTISVMARYGNTITNGLAAPLIIGAFWIISYVYMLNSSYREHALAASCFSTALIAFLFVGAGFLHPFWFMAYIAIFSVAMYGASKVGNYG